MKNKAVKQMICDIENKKHFGNEKPSYLHSYHDGQFGYWVYIPSGWFFRAVYLGKLTFIGAVK